MEYVSYDIRLWLFLDILINILRACVHNELTDANINMSNGPESVKHKYVFDIHVAENKTLSAV